MKIMADATAGRTPPPLPGLIAGGLVILGVLLWMFVSKGLLIVAGVGAFGPGILRELGWLRDQDEFQRQAAHRAGYHAYLVGGVTAVLVLSVLSWHGEESPVAPEWILLILAVMWTTWLFSALLDYQGAVKTASRVLAVYGSFWAVFVIADIIGESKGASEYLLGTLMGTLVVTPFFVLAWTAPRWPRRTGATLLAVSALFIVVFIVPASMRGIDLSGTLVTITLLLVPLLASGIALLREERGDTADGGA
jgi:hypothetical protein